MVRFRGPGIGLEACAPYAGWNFRNRGGKIALNTKASRSLALSGVIALAVLAIAAGFHAVARPQQRGSHTVYYVHGRIYSNDPAHPWAEAIAVADGKISCIGNLDHVLLDCGGGQEGVETVQLRGQFVMPGFNDAHVHLGGAAADLLAAPLTGVPSAEEMQKRVADAVARHKAGEWITGGGWDHTLWAEKRFPNRQQLDSVAPKNPVILTHISGHVAVANSLVLKNLAKNGVTSAQDFSDWEDFKVYKQLEEDEKLTVRIIEWLPFNLPLNDLQNMRAQGGTTDPWVKTGALKAFTDGAMGSRTAAMLEPYSDDPSTSGILTNDPV